MAKTEKHGAEGAAGGRRGGGFLRHLWEILWHGTDNRRKVAHNGHVEEFTEKDDKKKLPSSDSQRSSHTELRDGYDFQTVIDLDHNQKIELTFYGYKECAWKSLLYYVILCVTLGFMALVFHWNQHWALFVRRRRCTLREARFMLIVEKYKHSEASHHDAIHSEALQREEEEEHEVYFVETVHRVGVEEAKEQYLRERRRGVEKIAQKEPHSPDEVVKEKWFERFLKRRCLFEKEEVEVKIKNKDGGDDSGTMSKSPDTVTTLVMDDEDEKKEPEAKKMEEIKIHENFLKFLHFSVHFENGVFEGK